MRSRWTLKVLRRLIGRLIAEERSSHPDRLGESDRSRRAFVAGVAVSATALAACPSRGARVFSDAMAPRIAILGAGMAGLLACDTLRKAGLSATVYEARKRVGGRVLSDRRFNPSDPDRRAVELGGEFIDTDHTLMLALAAELGLQVFDSAAAAQLDVTYWFEGERHSEAAIVAAFMPIARAIMLARAEIAIPLDEIAYDHLNAAAERYDRMSLAEFCAYAGASKLATAVIESAYGGEFGLELAQQSSLNLIVMLADDDLIEATGAGVWAVYGSSDERYKIHGGNDHVPKGLADRNRAAIQLERPLTRVEASTGGTYRLSFASGPDVTADIVICTLPFSVLRDIELDLPIRPLKRRAIAELGYGTNSKLIVPFDRPVWEEHGDDGSVYGDGEVLSVWAPLFGQGEGPVALTQFRAGAQGAALGTSSDDEARFIEAAERLWPGLGAARGAAPALRITWPQDPWSKGSYACYKPGQWTAFGGIEGEPEGRFLFAGEHTSREFQGYMEGAARTGRRAAEEAIALATAGLAIGR